MVIGYYSFRAIDLSSGYKLALRLSFYTALMVMNRVSNECPCLECYNPLYFITTETRVLPQGQVPPVKHINLKHLLKFRYALYSTSKGTQPCSGLLEK